MKITVTEKHIKEGKRRNCFECPIALAIRDAFPTYEYINVGTTMFTITISCKDNPFSLPETACNFINAFDAEQKVSPIEFELTPR